MPSSVISESRHNPSTWKLARFLNNSFGVSDTDVGWEKNMNNCYDKAAEIMKRINQAGVFE